MDAAAKAIANGGKLVCIGAGSSAERMFKASENAVDVYENGVADAEKVLKAGDVLIGISAACGAEYVIGALEKAKQMLPVLPD